MKKSLRITLIVMVVLAAVGGIWLLLRQRQAKAQDAAVLRTAQVQNGLLEITVSASGNVAAAQRGDLIFMVPGTVAEINVKVGERVRKHQVLARLDTADLERAVRQSEILLEQAQLALQQAQQGPSEGDLRVAQAAVNSTAQALDAARTAKDLAISQKDTNLEQAIQQRDQAKALYEDLQARVDAGELPQWIADQAYIQYQQAEAQVKALEGTSGDLQVKQAKTQWLSAYSAYVQAKEALARLQAGASETQLRQLELQVEQAQINLEQAQSRLQQATLSAPFDGVVAAVNLREGAPAPTGMAAITILDDSTYYINVTIDETDIGKVAVGQPVTVTLDAYPNEKLTGRVDTIAPAATNIGGIVFYGVKVKLDPTDKVAVRDGMTASVLIVTDSIPDALLIPNWALRTEQVNGVTVTYTYVQASEGSLKKVELKTGARNESFTQVLEGLQAGDTVALLAQERTLLDLSTMR